MKAALLIVLSLSALALAGPAYNKNNQIDAHKQQQQQQQQQQYMTGDSKQTQATEILKQWCYSSQMSQQELTSTFKKLVGYVKSSPEDSSTEAAVMSERICQGAKSQQSASHGAGNDWTNNADAQAHDLIKDVYMDALIACDTRDCMSQLVKIINSNKIDTIRASYYMTRIAVTESDDIKDERDVESLAESFVNQPETQSEAIDRQKLFAVTALLGKSLNNKSEQQQQQQQTELKQTAQKVAKTIVERFIRPVSQQEVQQYQQQSPQQQSSQAAKKIAKRSAALKALANIPGWALKEASDVESTLQKLAQDKQEMNTVRQSAIECLEENDQAYQQLKQIAFDQYEPIEVRVAALRAAMSTVYAGKKSEQTKQQQAYELVDQTVKHCEDQRNQEHDDQFVLYATSYLDNIRTSQQPEHQAIKESIAKNKQHYMQISVLNKKFKQQLADVRKWSRNYKLEQEFNQIESGFVIEGDLVYESKKSQYAQQQYNNNNKGGSQQQAQILPKLARFNMSMPVMGKTVNVVEVTVRQNEMDDELLGALTLIQGAKFNSESMSKVVDSFKSSVEQSRNNQNNPNKQQESAEADLAIKVDGCTIAYVSVDDFKSSSSSSYSSQGGHQRNTRSAYSSVSIVEEVIEHLKRKPVAFNRGFNFNINERLAKVLDVDANVIAGLRFASRASGTSSKDFEIAAQVEPRFAFEAIVGPAKMSSKKLLQRVSTKTALGLRLRFKSNELAEVQVDLPMENMELFTLETQMVEKNAKAPSSYAYLPESIYGQEDIYAIDDWYARSKYPQMLVSTDDDEDTSAAASGSSYARPAGSGNSFKGIRKMKRSIFEKKQGSNSIKSLANSMMPGKPGQYAASLESSENVARATGLRAKLRAVVAPKELSFLMQAYVQKYDSRMQGYRVQFQNNQRNSAGQKQYTVTVSTPGSTIDRTMQVRIAKQSTPSRTYVKTEMSSPKGSATAQYELIHDGRQYAVKAEIASARASSQWRHTVEAGVQRSSQSPSGRIATTYKPYASIDSTSFKRPAQMQGVISYQQSPKTVISYELKSPTSGDFVQGKFILDERTPAYLSKRASSTNVRRSMQSPIEIILKSDVTVTSETVGQVDEHAFKVHKMIDWDSSKYAVNADFSAAHKNLRKSTESTASASLKLDADQQVLTVQRKSPQQQQQQQQQQQPANFRLTVASDTKSSNGHALVAEARYSNKRTSNAIAAYKHKVEFYKSPSSKKVDFGYTVELVSSEAQINEKITGRTQADFERKMKTMHTEISARNKQAKVDMEYESLAQHQVQVSYQGPRIQHRASVRADQNQFSAQSRTDKSGQMLAKIALDISKQQDEAQLVVEMPTERTHVAADFKLGAGKLSSLAVQTPRFSSKAEFSFEAASGGAFSKRSPWTKALGPIGNLRFKSDLKDNTNQEAYWLDSSLNNNDSNDKSYFRFDSPIYRTDVEYDPRAQDTKIGAFARSKRSVKSYGQLYSAQDSLLSSPFDNNKLNLGNKLWMIRSIVSSPSSVNQMKQKARRALFEYADRRQQHKHSFNWNPTDERFNFSLNRQAAAAAAAAAAASPMRFSGDFATNFYNTQQRPSSLSMASKYADFDFNAQPFDGSESYATLSALSRHPRSLFKKHNSELRYKKHAGYKASMNHQDANDRRHSFQFEADNSPKNWAKMSYDSDKHGKGQYEHSWRKQVAKRNNSDNQADYYANKIAFGAQSAKQGAWKHNTNLAWDEPASMSAGRFRRSMGDYAAFASAANSRYSALNYLKHVNARLNSQTNMNQANLYDLDFDYKPQAYAARFNLAMPTEMHASSFEYEPIERLYKLQSKLYNRQTNMPTYEFKASTKPSLANFIDQQHPMLASPFAGTAYSLFKQPLKLDYSDKYGRAARFDYDQSPLSSVGTYAGLHQKRAALYYKNEATDFEHDSSYDFYPETTFGGFKASSKRASGDYSIKASTKYGPILLEADSDDQSTELKLVSPVVRAKMSAETTSRGNQLIKFDADNKQQSVQLAKIIRDNAPKALRDSKFVQKAAQKYDQGRFEHDTELLASIVDAIIKIKSQTMMSGRPALILDGEFNMQQEKAYVKINGERTKGQLVVDLLNNSANLVLDVDDKRTLQHQTRVLRTSNKYYTLDSMTSYKQQPMLKLSGKISALAIEDPAHLFARRRSGSYSGEHISTFEAILFEPKQMQVSGLYDCLKKEAHVYFKDVQNMKTQETVVKFDDQTDTITVDARLSAPYGPIYTTKAKINLTGLVQPDKCYSQSCQSEVIYADKKSGLWAAKYAPGEYISVNTPRGKQLVNLTY